MPKESYVRARTESQLKREAEAIFARLGFNMTEAINMFLVQVTMHNGLPFAVRIPPGDAQYQKTRDFLFENWQQQLNDAIEEAEQDVLENKLYTMDEARFKTSHIIEQARQNHEAV